MFLYFLLALLILATVSSFSIGGTIFRTSKLSMSTDFYGIVEKDGKGKEFAFEKLRGKVVYGVNVASKCGYTASGYALLEKVAAMSVRFFFYLGQYLEYLTNDGIGLTLSHYTPTHRASRCLSCLLTNLGDKNLEVLQRLKNSVH